MSTHLHIPCPQCQNSLKVRREYLGRRVQCKHCAHVFEALDPAAPSETGEETSFEELLIRELDQEPEPARVEVGQASLARGDQGSPSDEYGEILSPLDPSDRLGLSLPESPDDDREHQERQRSEELQQELVAAQDELRTLRSQVDRLNERNAWADRLEEELNEAKSQIETLRAELQDASTSVLPTDLPSIEAAAQEHADVLAERDRLSAEADELRARLALLERGQDDQARAESQELANVLAERDRLNAEADELRAELNSVQLQGRDHAQTLASLQAERDDLARNLETARQTHKSELETQLSQWNDERQSLLNDARANLNQHQTRAEAEALRWQEQLDQARGQFDRERSELNARIETLTTQADRHAARAQELETLSRQADQRHQAEMDAQRTSAAQLESALDQMRRKADAESKRAGDLTTQVQQQQDQLEALRLEHETQVQSLQGRLDALGLDLETARSDAQTGHDQAARIIAERDDQITKLQTKLQEHHKKLETIQAEREQAAETIRGHELTIQEHQGRLADRDRDLADRQAALESAQAEARGERERAAETERRQTAEIEQLRARQAEQATEIESLHAVASTDRQRADDAAEAARLERDRLVAEVQSLSESQTALKAELTNAQTKIAELNAELNAAQEAKNQIRGLLSRIGIQLPA